MGTPGNVREFERSSDPAFETGTGYTRLVIQRLVAEGPQIVAHLGPHTLSTGSTTSVIIGPVFGRGRVAVATSVRW
jgi:hypothetical protein